MVFCPCPAFPFPARANNTAAAGCASSASGRRRLYGIHRAPSPPCTLRTPAPGKVSPPSAGKKPGIRRRAPPSKRRQACQAPAPHDTPPPCANLYRIFSAVFARLPVATARGLYQLLQQPEHRQMRGINAIPHPGGHAQVALPAQEHQRQRQNRQRLRA